MFNSIKNKISNFKRFNISKQNTKDRFNIGNRLMNKRGSMVVEAAIFLPIFIIGMITLGYLVKFNAVQENVFHSFADETGKLAAEASIKPYALNYKSRVINRVNDENNNGNNHIIKDVNVTNHWYRIPYNIPSQTDLVDVQTDIIAASIDYDISIGLPVRFINSIPASDTIVCRAFVGDQQTSSPMPFSDMEKDEDSELVWVFPKYGTKYHDENCSVIKNDPREQLLSSQIRNVYSPCKTCKPSDLRDGNLVYCFITGDVYHKGECSTVTKYVTSIQKDDAINRGYGACSKCGGTGGNKSE